MCTAEDLVLAVTAFVGLIGTNTWESRSERGYSDL